MPVPIEETQLYYAYVREIVAKLDSLKVPPDKILWHYTNGQALIGILNSASLFTTQVSCLNDSTEVRYASRLLQAALHDMRPKQPENSLELKFIEGAIQYFKEDPVLPAHAGLPYFVACFSDKEDDLSQWRAYGGGEGGYALGFRAGDLSGINGALVARVNYTRELHQNLAREVATQMIFFFMTGLEKYGQRDTVKWGEEFLGAWDTAVTMVAPLIKDPGFSSECEYRVVKTFRLEELPQLRFSQRQSLLARHLPIRPTGPMPTEPNRLPICRVMVGPSRHSQISRISVDTLLRQKGYPTGMVSISASPFQIT